MRFAVLAVALAACNPTSSGEAPDAAGPDAPDGTGCTALTPRSTVPETFVGPTGLQTRMAALIDSAQSTLDVAMYLFTVKDLANHIVTAKQRGVAVRVILDPDEAGNAAVTPIFNTGGVTWKNASSIYPFSHA